MKKLKETTTQAIDTTNPSSSVLYIKSLANNINASYNLIKNQEA